jgi:hypothetical protein
MNQPASQLILQDSTSLKLKSTIGYVQSNPSDNIYFPSQFNIILLDRLCFLRGHFPEMFSLKYSVCLLYLPSELRTDYFVILNLLQFYVMTKQIHYKLQRQKSMCNYINDTLNLWVSRN